MLKNSLSEHKKKEYNELISKNTRLLLNMIEDLIDTSKVESGTLQIMSKKVNVNDIINQLEVPLSELIVNKNRQNLKVVKENLRLNNHSIVTDPSEFSR
jgi:signal transduction histidine kinase